MVWGYCTCIIIACWPAGMGLILRSASKRLINLVGQQRGWPPQSTNQSCYHALPTRWDWSGRILFKKTDLWAIEGAIFRVELPRMAKLLQRLLQLLLCLVPQCRVSHELLRPCGEVELERETKDAIHCLQKVQTALYLRFYLERRGEKREKRERR